MPAAVADVPHAWVRLGAAGEGMRLLRENGVEELVLAGRGAAADACLAAPGLARARNSSPASAPRRLGDDGLLRAVIRELEEEGFRVVSVDGLLADALAPEGAIGALVPDAELARPTSRAASTVARALGALDVGQAVVVQQGLVLGVEAIEGTDALIARCGALRREGRGGVLVKIAEAGTGAARRSADDRRRTRSAAAHAAGLARDRRRGRLDAADRPRRDRRGGRSRPGSSSSASRVP